MSWVTWVLILTGVGLNAAAQLLLKVAARPLGHFSDFGLETLRYSVMSLGASLPFWAGMLCYGASVCVWLVAAAHRCFADHGSLSIATYQVTIQSRSMGHLTVDVPRGVCLHPLTVQPTPSIGCLRWCPRSYVVEFHRQRRLAGEKLNGHNHQFPEERIPGREQ